MQASAEASATIDLLPAADRAATGMGVRLSHDVLLTGHSQGGAAAMAVGQALQQQNGRWRLRALAPMAGTYDLAGTEVPAVADPQAVDPHRASVYLAYLLIEWNRLYGLYTDPIQVFQPPFAGTVDTLFDGAHGFDDIVRALPSPEQLFQPAFLATLHHPTGPLAEALQANDVCRWAPRAPTMLFAGDADRDAIFANTEQCRNHIRAQGGDAAIADMGNVDHVGTGVAALPVIRAWFTALSAPQSGLTGTVPCPSRSG